MTLGHDASWWTAFGAIAQVAGAVATLLAVLVALWTTRGERELKGKGHARIMLEVRHGVEYGHTMSPLALKTPG